MKKIIEIFKKLFVKISNLKFVKVLVERWNNLKFVKNLKEQGIYHQFLAKMWLFIVTVLFISISLVIFNNSNTNIVDNKGNQPVQDNQNIPDNENKTPIDILLEEIDVVKNSGTYSYIITGKITEGMEAHSENVTVSKVTLNGVESYKFEFNGYSLGEDYNNMTGTYYVTQMGGIFCVVDNNMKNIYEQTSVNFGGLYDKLMNQVAENRFDFSSFVNKTEKEVEMKTVKEGDKTYEVLTRIYEIEYINNGATSTSESNALPVVDAVSGANMEQLEGEVVDAGDMPTISGEDNITNEETVVETGSLPKVEDIKLEKITEIIKYCREDKTVKYVKDTEDNDLCIIFKVIDGSEEIDFSQYTKVVN